MTEEKQAKKAAENAIRDAETRNKAASKLQFAKWLSANDVESWNDNQIDAYHDVESAASEYDIAGVIRACHSLKNNTKKAQSWPAAPDAKFERLQTSMLKHSANAATYCINGWENLDMLLIEKITVEMGLASADANRLAARLEEINES